MVLARSSMSRPGKHPIDRRFANTTCLQANAMSAGDYDCVWQPLGDVCPGAAVAGSNHHAHHNKVCVPIEQLPKIDWRVDTNAPRPVVFNKAALTGAPSGFERRLYIDLGSRDYTSSIGSWFMNEYPSASTFDIEAFEVSTEYDSTYEGHGVALHHFAAWMANGTIPWTQFNPKMGGIAVSDMDPTAVASAAHAGGESATTRPAIDIAAWLRRVARRTDYVVLKMDIEGAEVRPPPPNPKSRGGGASPRVCVGVVPRLPWPLTRRVYYVCARSQYAVVPHLLLQPDVSWLIDEMYIEVHTTVNSCCAGRSDRRFEDAVNLVRRLREAGIYAHDWD